MTASPLEARCSVCLDTGSKSQDIDDFLNCTSCDAAERRMEMQNYVSGLSPLMSNWAKCWVAYNLGMQRQAARIAAQPAPAPATETIARFWNAVEVRNHEMRPAIPKLPSTPEEVEAFIADNFDSEYPSDKLEDVRYKLSIHDLLSCFQNLADVAGEAAQPVEVAGQVPKAWMRKWYADAEIPAKVKGVWPKKFKFKSVTDVKIFPDDQPLYAAPPPAAQPSDDVVLKAKRYDWLCDNAHRVTIDLTESQEYIDRTIDAAMAKEKA